MKLLRGFVIIKIWCDQTMASPNFKGEPSYEMAEQSVIKSSNAMIAIIRLVRINKTKIFGGLLIPFI